MAESKSVVTKDIKDNTMVRRTLARILKFSYNNFPANSSIQT